MDCKEAQSFKMPFGKYKGKTMQYIIKTDKKYVLWMIKNIDLHSPLKDVLELLNDDIYGLPKNEFEEEFNKLKQAVKSGKTIYGVNIHSVGFEFRVLPCSLEEVVGNQYSLNGKTITKAQHAQVYQFLEPLWKKSGEQWQNRGLY